MSTLVSQTIPERKGFQVRWRYFIALAILLPVMVHLFYAFSHSPLMNYYMTIDELAAAGKPGTNVRVGADVVPGSIDWDDITRTLTFELKDGNRVLRVAYRGFAPDALRDGATAVVEGELNQDGSFTAYNVSVKCPHRYAAI